MAWGKKTPQEKADSFDRQFAANRTEGQRKQAAGEYPYDLDAKQKPTTKPAEKRGKGKHRRG